MCISFEISCLYLPFVRQLWYRNYLDYSTTMSQLKAEKIYQDFVPVAKYWLKELEYYGQNQFKTNIGQYPWTIGQLYDYLLNGVMEYHFEAIHCCLQRKQGHEKGKKTVKGIAVMLMGKYFPTKMKPGYYSPYQPQQMESIEKTQDLMFRFLKEMHKLAKEIDAAGVVDYKFTHPKFGDLTATEWYRVIEMEFKYFTRYKKKMDLEIRSFTKVDDEDELIDA